MTRSASTPFAWRELPEFIKRARNGSDFRLRIAYLKREDVTGSASAQRFQANLALHRAGRTAHDTNRFERRQAPCRARPPCGALRRYRTIFLRLSGTSPPNRLRPEPHQGADCFALPTDASELSVPHVPTPIFPCRRRSGSERSAVTVLRSIPCESTGGALSSAGIQASPAAFDVFGVTDERKRPGPPRNCSAF